MKSRPKGQRPAGGGPFADRTTRTTSTSSANAVALAPQGADIAPDGVAATRTDNRATGEPHRRQPGPPHRVTGSETRGIDDSDDQTARLCASVADMDADARRSDRTCAGGSELSRTPASNGYTVAQFAKDIAPLLPLALPELRRYGLMKACAHCGNPLDSVTFVLRSRKIPGGTVEANVLTICGACAARPLDLSKGDWAHVCDASGLILHEDEWPLFTKVLRSNAIRVALRGYHGVVLTTVDTPWPV